MYRGTYRPNRRPVYTTAPDCLVYLNGELTLPSGSNPNRRVDIQPFINSVSVNSGIDAGSGSATLSLHIPAHHMNDIYAGGRLSITTMMEVKIYMKGHFTVGGAPRYYPVFWGLTTSVDESYGAGEHTVSLACSDMLHWWAIQQININPSWFEASENQQATFTHEGNIFTGMNPFSVMHTLARRVYGDSMNVLNTQLTSQQIRSEPMNTRANGNGPELSMQAYWAARWGRLANSLRMYGPNGNVLVGEDLDFILNPRQFARGSRDDVSRSEADILDTFRQGDVNFAQVSPFSLAYSQLSSLELTTNTFDTKLNLANMVKEAIGYEFFMDVTGEIIFKPPFYNLDVRPNYPVSWIRDVDVVDWNFAENEPEVTFLEATGFRFSNREVGLSSDVQPHATYVDYRLVQKYGWRPGSFSSEFIGSDEFGSQKALFFHLVDVLDRENVRVNSGSVTIPLRPELRLGYPVYIEGRDAYYYVESLAHTFSYGSRCSTQLTLKARRQKFYGAFGRWANESQEPKPGDIADPGVAVHNMYKRDIDIVSGTPQGDRNVIMTYLPERELGAKFENAEAFEEFGENSDSQVLRRNLISMRAQFGTRGDNKYVYMIDPNRDVPHESEDTGERIRGPVTSIESNPQIDADVEGRRMEVSSVIFPVSDERGYEVVGTYEYGRRVTINGSGNLVFDKQERDVQVESLLHMQPDQNTDGNTTPDLSDSTGNQAPTTFAADPNKDPEFMVDPNNYGRVLTEVQPPTIGPTDLTGFAQTEADRLRGDIRTAPQSGPSTTSMPSPEGSGTGDPGFSSSGGGRTFRYNSNVARWRALIRQERAALGLSEEDYSDELLLGLIHVESVGNPDARRTNANGRLSQFCGILQIGEANAADTPNNVPPRQNTDFLGDPGLSIRHFLQYQEQYKDRHRGDPERQALLWKGGPGFLDGYNRISDSGATAQQIDAWVAGYPPTRDSPWGINNYLDMSVAAREVWASALVEPPEIPQDLPIEEAEEVINSAISEAAKAASDEAEDPIASSIVNVMGLPNAQEELAYERKLFEERLNEAREAGLTALPDGIKPPRDPSIAPVITRYLQDLYQSAFGPVKAREAELRGHTRSIPRVPDAASIPTSTPEEEREGIDTPLGRKEVRDALERGETYNSLFDPGGVVDQLMMDIEDAATLPDEED